jgi:ribosomal-protein-alanine N-acetyltransferase
MATVHIRKKREICVEFKLKNGEVSWIRNMNNEDLETVFELECLVFEDPWSFSNFQHEIARSAVSWPLIVETNYEIVGYTIPWFVADEMHLANIATSPIYFRQGIANRIMIVLFDECIRRKINRVFLEVRPTNTSAIVMYEKFGFERIGIRRRYYRNGENAIVMQRFIPFQQTEDWMIAD